jgi:protein-S-isoprenylcysteine O-methyltransferase Ste14
MCSALRTYLNIIKLIGKAPINPAVFYSGKIAGYALWIALLVSMINAPALSEWPLSRQLALLLTSLSLVVIVCSLINLGSATRLGLPEESTQLKTEGLYRISRNPMYLGFNLLSFSAILFIGNSFVLALGTYSIFTYHLIIRAEEKFLEARFGEKYCAYKNRVHRYI